MAIYSDHRQSGRTSPNSNWLDRLDKPDLQERDLAERKRLAAHLVERGARLRIPAVMNISMALRRIKPGVAHLATDVFDQQPELLNFMPDKTPGQRIWLGGPLGVRQESSQVSALGRQDMFPKCRPPRSGGWLIPQHPCGFGVCKRAPADNLSPPVHAIEVGETVSGLSAEWHAKPSPTTCLALT